MPTFNLVFEHQPIASETLTQPSCYKRAERNTDTLIVWQTKYIMLLGFTELLLTFTIFKTNAWLL